jgi:hypothetical protein
MNKQNKEDLLVIFTDESNSKLFELEKKYNLQANNNEWTENEGAIVRGVKDFKLEKISKNDFVKYLEKNLKTHKEDAKKITEDVIDELVPLLEVITEEERQQKVEALKNNYKNEVINENPGPIKLNKPLGVLSALKREMQKQEIGGMIPKDDLPEDNLPFIEEPEEESAIPEPERPMIEESKQEAPKKQNSSDTYREPIE